MTKKEAIELVSQNGAELYQAEFTNLRLKKLGTKGFGGQKAKK